MDNCIHAVMRELGALFLHPRGKHAGEEIKDERGQLNLRGNKTLTPPPLSVNVASFSFRSELGISERIRRLLLGAIVTDSLRPVIAWPLIRLAVCVCVCVRACTLSPANSPQ